MWLWKCSTLNKVYCYNVLLLLLNVHRSQWAHVIKHTVRWIVWEYSIKNNHNNDDNEGQLYSLVNDHLFNFQNKSNLWLAADIFLITSKAPQCCAHRANQPSQSHQSASNFARIPFISKPSMFLSSILFHWNLLIIELAVKCIILNTATLHTCGSLHTTVGHSLSGKSATTKISVMHIA